MQTLRVPTSITEQEEVQVEVTRLLVECYFDIVRANLQVPHNASHLSMHQDFAVLSGHLTLLVAHDLDNLLQRRIVSVIIAE